MPKRTDIRRILILGAGPIVIGQACEFDYSGSQACRTLLAEGYEVILVNSNPATIMTDPELSTRTYIEPLTCDSVTRIIERERPDALLPTMGGQTALNLAFDLSRAGVLEEYQVQLIGANFRAIEVGEDREAFKVLMASIGLESMHSETVNTLAQAQAVAQRLGFPFILRPAFTMGGSGGSVVFSASELVDKVTHALTLSPIDQVLMEESALGWKEFEFEVMRDRADNVVIVCSVENFDPMGVHTGDSITVAPAQTLTDREFQAMRNASIQIIRAVGVDAGGCNIQFAVHPKTGRMVVIEMNPRVSRSSALVSKATGVPIAKISARLAVGYTLDEIPNDITRSTPASFEPAIDYVVTKIPRFSFDKFPEGGLTLSPQMKSVGEVMAIGRTFQESFQKALRGLESITPKGLFPNKMVGREELERRLRLPTADRILWVYQALHQGFPVPRIHALSGIDPWFLDNVRQVVETLDGFKRQTVATVSPQALRQAKQLGIGDAQLALALQVSEPAIADLRRQHDILPVYKAVDTCAGEFEALTPYYYSTYDPGENEAPPLVLPSPLSQLSQGTIPLPEVEGSSPSPAGSASCPLPKGEEGNKRVMILGGGPNRIGQGIEFDYCCVHAAQTLRQLGYESVMVNSNPETVSTDYDISDRLYFEPLTVEDVGNLLVQEQPMGVIAQLGGQTPLKLAHALQHHPNFKPLGTTVATIDAAEDREQFRAIMDRLNLQAPASGIARTAIEALEVAAGIGYPVMVRPSYVLGGRGMYIVYSADRLAEVLDEVLAVEPDQPVLIDRFLQNASELDVDAISDGKTTYVAAILEHIEHAGVHSGDSACVWPAQNLSETMIAQVHEATALLAEALGVVGLLNIQFAIADGQLYVLEVNPRASRTVPFVGKCTGLPIMRMAVRVMLGEPLSQVLADELPAQLPQGHVAVKLPVFPFIKFRETDPKLGPEMRSTGEVMGIDQTFPLAYAKALAGAGFELPMQGQVFISVNNRDKPQAIAIARQYQALGFGLLATEGTARYLCEYGLNVQAIEKKHEGTSNAETLLEQGGIQLVINTPEGEEALNDDSYIRKAAVIHNIPMATTLTAAAAMAQAIEALKAGPSSVRCLQELYGG
jgi:carbamoyl-phosphate synthase large subunit